MVNNVSQFPHSLLIGCPPELQNFSLYSTDSISALADYQLTQYICGLCYHPARRRRFQKSVSLRLKPTDKMQPTLKREMDGWMMTAKHLKKDDTIHKDQSFMDNRTLTDTVPYSAGTSGTCKRLRQKNSINC